MGEVAKNKGGESGRESRNDCDKMLQETVKSVVDHTASDRGH